MKPFHLCPAPWWLAGFVAVFAAHGSDLPTGRQIVDSVAERSRQEASPDAALKARYAFSRERLLEVRDSGGKLKQRDAKTVEHVPKGPATNDLVTTAEGHRPAAGSDEKKRAYERRDFKLDRELLDRFEFDLAGSEIIGGRKVWLIDFRPAANAPAPHGMKEKFIGLVAGRIWVDADEHEATRIEFHLTAPVNLVGGLAGAVKSCRATFERDRTAEGVWYTRLLVWHLEGRQFLSSRVMDFVEEIQNVRLAAH